MAVEDKFADEIMSNEELDNVAGGTFNGNKYNEGEYNAIGIKTNYHFFAKDEFWWKGQEIGHDNASHLVFFFKRNGRNANTLEEATKFCDEHSKDYFLDGTDDSWTSDFHED